MKYNKSTVNKLNKLLQESGEKLNGLEFLFVSQRRDDMGEEDFQEVLQYPDEIANNPEEFVSLMHEPEQPDYDEDPESDDYMDNFISYYDGVTDKSFEEMSEQSSQPFEINVLGVDTKAYFISWEGASGELIIPKSDMDKVNPSLKSQIENAFTGESYPK